jgi:hypothetical protein
MGKPPGIEEFIGNLRISLSNKVKNKKHSIQKKNKLS